MSRFYIKGTHSVKIGWILFRRTVSLTLFRHHMDQNCVIQLLGLPPGVEARRTMIRNRIKEYRARFDMKQEELAQLVGVRRETIGNLEKGKYNPSLVLAWNIAKVFGVSIEEIFTVED